MGERGLAGGVYLHTVSVGEEIITEINDAQLVSETKYDISTQDEYAGFIFARTDLYLLLHI